MTAYRVSFDLDLSTQLGDQAADPEKARAYVERAIIDASRQFHKDALHAVRKDGQMPEEDKAPKMAIRLQAIMAGTMAKANLVLGPLPAGTVVNAKLPFEGEDD